MPAPHVGPLPCPEAAVVAVQVSSPCTGAPLYVSSRQIHEDLRFPLFANHIRALAEGFDLADMGNSLVRKLGVFLR